MNFVGNEYGENEFGLSRCFQISCRITKDKKNITFSKKKKLYSITEALIKIKTGLILH